MKTLAQFHQQEERITKKFLTLRDKAKAQQDFWCHSKEANDFYGRWDKKFNRIQTAINNYRKIVTAEYNV